MAAVMNALEEVIEESAGPVAPAIVENAGEGYDASLRMAAFHGASSELLEAPVFVAPLVLEETGALPRVDRAACAPRPRGREGRRPLALVAAITVAVALAGALSLMAADRRADVADAPIVPPAAGSDR